MLTALDSHPPYEDRDKVLCAILDKHFPDAVRRFKNIEDFVEQVEEASKHNHEKPLQLD